MSNRRGKQSARLDFIASIETRLSEFHKANKCFENKASFSFQFFDNNNSAGCDFKDLTHEQLCKLIEKLKAYSKESLQHWKQTRVGGGKNHILEIYGDFPSPSGFTKPVWIPEKVMWGRFRLEGDFRLPGFVLPNAEAEIFGVCKDTFYIVFLDPHHEFYKG